MAAKERVKQFIVENLVIAEDVEIGDNDDIFNKGFVNSLFAMKLLNFIESTFEITIENDDIEITNFNTLNHIMDFITKRLETK